ncbi:arginine--tRNA ligase [Candidatus Nanohalovita haloferacivicina]|uniref:arginine--tRNA ligase n=1 Tax=Candidatus Nanohalovita haloferacivicina TaxID=2978046 RepID=UPI00325FBEAE|nr:Arginyl-tRNA synthetase [Candidatus Nanohalobia archaeon BNXNv]
MNQVKELLAQKLSEKLDVEVSDEDIERPEPEHGDFAYPVMKAASQLGENPRKLAEELSEQLEEVDIVESVEVAGPGYLNFFLDRSVYGEEVVEGLESENFGVVQNDGSVLVEFSSPNIAKPMNVGHLRNNALGDSLRRILSFSGYDVTAENYIGDLGTQFGKVIYGHKNIDSNKNFEEEPIEYMLDIYVKFHELAEEDEEVEEEARAWAKKIEDGDDEAVRLWKKFREATLEYHKDEYDRLDIKFDRITGESKVFEEARELVESWVEEGKVERDDDGSIFYEFDDEEMPGVVLLKADGSTLYITRDLYNLKKRNEEGFDYNLYIVASEQELHFKQLFQVAEDMGIETEGSEHISYGMLQLPEGSMSTRKGLIIEQSEIFDKAVEMAEEKAEEEINRNLENAEAIGIGAVKYSNLSVSRKKDMEFNWDTALSFKGDSGPYLQYSNVRAKSILRKASSSGELGDDFDDAEYRLLKKLSEFPEKVEAAAEHREPAKIAHYLSELCEEFNGFYHECPVLDSGRESHRLKLVELFVDVTDKGLDLLGIQALEEM